MIRLTCACIGFVALVGCGDEAHKQTTSAGAGGAGGAGGAAVSEERCTVAEGGCLVAEVNVPTALAVRDGAVYWTTQLGELHRRDPAGIVSALATGVYAGGLFVTSTTVYATSPAGASDTRVVAVPQGGGAPVTVVPASDGFVFGAGIVGDDDDVFWVGPADGEVTVYGRIAAANGVHAESFQPGQVRNIGFDGSFVYGARSGGEILRISRDGTDVETIAALDFDVFAVTADETSVYATGNGSLVEIALSNGASTVLATNQSFGNGNGDVMANGLRARAGNVYWVTIESVGERRGGAVERLGAGETAITRIHYTERDVTAIELDDEFVYVGLQSEIRKFRRPEAAP